MTSPAFVERVVTLNVVTSVAPPGPIPSTDGVKRDLARREPAAEEPPVFAREVMPMDVAIELPVAPHVDLPIVADAVLVDVVSVLSMGPLLDLAPGTTAPSPPSGSGSSVSSS